MTDTDSMISISKRMETLQAENDELRKLLEGAPLTTPTGYSRKMLWKAWEVGRLTVGHADPIRDSRQLFNRWLLGPMGENHPISEDDALLVGLVAQLPKGTPQTVEGIVGAVADMALKLDAHEDASTPAFDEIAKLCGCPEWGYPGQLVRDVENVVKERDKLRKDKAENDVQHQAMRACIVYARDRRGRGFVFEDWEMMVEYALRAGEVPPHALEDAHTNELRAWKAVKDIREERDELRVRLGAALGNGVDTRAECEGLRDRLRIAEVSRDDARAASQRYLDEKRAVQEKYDAQCEDQRRTVEQKNGAYAERDLCVAGLAALAVRLGWSAWLGRHEPDPKWDQDWMNIVFINLPTGQVSWHIHDSEVGWFSFLPTILERPWDGHTTAQKYERLAGILGNAAPYPSNLDEHIRRAAEDAMKPDSAPRIAYNRVYEVMGNEGTADERGELFWRTLREVRDGTFKPTLCDHLSAEVHWAGLARCGACKAELTMEQVAAMRPELAERAWLPSSHPTLEAPGQCPWLFPDEDPDEGYWHCKHRAGHDDTHETEFGGGRGARWTLSSQLTPEAQTQFGINAKYCECSLKYRGLAPGVHASYCPLSGRPLAPFGGHGDAG